VRVHEPVEGVLFFSPCCLIGCDLTVHNMSIDALSFSTDYPVMVVPVDPGLWTRRAWRRRRVSARWVLVMWPHCFARASNLFERGTVSGVPFMRRWDVWCVTRLSAPSVLMNTAGVAHVCVDVAAFTRTCDSRAQCIISRAFLCSRGAVLQGRMAGQGDARHAIMTRTFTQVQLWGKSWPLVRASRCRRLSPWSYGRYSRKICRNSTPLRRLGWGAVRSGLRTLGNAPCGLRACRCLSLRALHVAHRRHDSICVDNDDGS
jgi:hypothetical protein